MPCLDGKIRTELFKVCFDERQLSDNLWKNILRTRKKDILNSKKYFRNNFELDKNILKTILVFDDDDDEATFVKLDESISDICPHRHDSMFQCESTL